jgi:hypothetical protein
MELRADFDAFSAADDDEEEETVALVLLLFKLPKTILDCSSKEIRKNNRRLA